MKYQNDIDKMNTNRNLFLMSLPIFVELLLQLLVGNVDQMMVSRVSQPSVAAIVNANQIMNLVIIVLSMASNYEDRFKIPDGSAVVTIKM